MRIAFGLQANNYLNNTCAFFMCKTFAVLIQVIKKHALFIEFYCYMYKQGHFPFDLQYIKCS